MSFEIRGGCEECKFNELHRYNYCKKFKAILHLRGKEWYFRRNRKWNGYRSLCDECYDNELERGLGDE